jgi:hypothetical protein
MCKKPCEKREHCWGCPFDHQVKDGERGKSTVSARRLAMLCTTSHARNPLHESLCGLTRSKQPQVSQQIPRICATRWIEGKECHPGCHHFTDSKLQKPSKRLNARRSYVDARGCLQFLSRWFCGSFLLTWRRLCQTLLRPIVSACPISPAVREIVPYTSSLIHFSFAPLM